MIKAVEREYQSVRIAVARLSAAVARDPAALGAGVSPRNLKAADDHLEGTYLIRMFAEFETAVRSHWGTIRPRARTQVKSLLDNVGALRGMPSDVIANPHKAREHRNRLVHERDDVVEAVPFTDARRHLAIYLTRLSSEWDDWCPSGKAA